MLVGSHRHGPDGKSMREGWLIRDGEVLASSVHPNGWRAHLVSSDQFANGIGAVVVTGPAVVIGAAVARLGEKSRLESVSVAGPVHVIGPGRQAVALVSDIATELRVGDDLQFRDAS
jgi:hypothetical protein